MAWLAATAGADCADLLEHLDAGLGSGAGARLARSEPWTQADVDCLVEAGVDRSVVLAAARSSRLPIPDHLRPRWELGALVGYIPTRNATIGGTFGGHLAYWPVQRVGLALTAAVAPQDSTHYSSAAVGEPVYPELTEVVSTTALTVQLAPLAGELDTGSRSAELLGVVIAGFGVAETVESELLEQGYIDPDATDVYSAHPTLNYGLGLIVAPSGPVGLRLQVDQARWIESIDGDTFPAQRVQLAAALTWRP